MNRTEKIHSSNVTQALRLQSARKQSAMHAVNLALARWTNVDVEAELARTLPSSSRSRWHAVAQDNFMAWLNAGGFAQQGPESNPAGAPQVAADGEPCAALATPGCDCTA